MGRKRFKIKKKKRESNEVWPEVPRGVKIKEPFPDIRPRKKGEA